MNKVMYRGANSGRGPSPEIWAGCPILDMILDPNVGVHFFDDFLNFGVGATDATNGYKFYIDSSNTVSQLATEVNGVVQLLTDTTDNDAPILTTGGNTAGMGKIVTSTGKNLWFEARIRVASAALTEMAMFIGLTEEACAADNGLISDNPDTDIATVMADKDYIGFANFTNAAPVLAACYKKAGGTDVVVDSNVQTLALDTWYKLGLKFDVINDTLKWYVDGVEQASLDVSGAGTTNFPSGEELALTFGFKNGTTTAKKLDIDWVRFAQLA
jgi:hypothetical protein